MKNVKIDTSSYHLLNVSQMHLIVGGQWVKVFVNGDVVWLWV